VTDLALLPKANKRSEDAESFVEHMKYMNMDNNSYNGSRQVHKMKRNLKKGILCWHT
jgi:hypothetical protein